MMTKKAEEDLFNQELNKPVPSSSRDKPRRGYGVDPEAAAAVEVGVKKKPMDIIKEEFDNLRNVFKPKN